jgi:hypothetical protein
VIDCGCTERHGILFRDAVKSFSASNYQLFIPTLLIRGSANLQGYCLYTVYSAATLLVTKAIHIASIIRDKMASQFSPYLLTPALRTLTTRCRTWRRSK